MTSTDDYERIVSLGDVKWPSVDIAIAAYKEGFKAGQESRDALLREVLNTVSVADHYGSDVTTAFLLFMLGDVAVKIKEALDDK